MRRTTVSLVLLGLAGALAFMLVTRYRTSPPAHAVTTAETKTGGDGGTSPSIAAEKPAGAAEAAPRAVTLGRPLRVVAHGWDLMVPGLIAKERGETSSRGLEVEFRAVETLGDIERALAAGGIVDKGADIAIVPLPLLALMYEDLRALEPALFWVVGYSRGRDALYASELDFRKPPSGKITVIGDPERAAVFLALYALDLAGADIKKVTLAPTDAVAPGGTVLAAIDRSEGYAERLAATRELLLSTHDATTLVPYVAIAPRGFLTESADVATAFGAAWLRGVDALRADVPGAARTVAALAGAPEPVVLIKRLGQIEFVDLVGNAELFGLSGRSAVSAHSLLRTSFRLWREAGVITSSAPEAAPIVPTAVSTLVFGKGAVSGSPTKGAAIEDAAPLIVGKPVKLDEDAALERLGTLAGLFSRSVIAVGWDGRKETTEALIARAAERFGIDPARLVLASKLAKRGVLGLAVMPQP